MLTIDDHRRDAAGLTYVYPVLSRRAGGLSIGINLNPNRACNWRCRYCQVEGLIRGRAPPINLTQLEEELDGFLAAVLQGDYLRRHAPPGARTLVDIAFSGDGEPTSATAFAAIVQRVGEVMQRHGLIGRTGLTLISNGSLMHRPGVQAGLRTLAQWGGEVWFKVDSVTPRGLSTINGTRCTPEAQTERLLLSAGLCPTWIQTCLFAIDGAEPDDRERTAYLDWLRQLLAEHVPLRGVRLYGLARAPRQADGASLSPLPAEWLQALGREIAAAGLTVQVSP